MSAKGEHMTFETAVDVFKTCFPRPRWSAESFEIKKTGVFVPAFPGVHNKFVYYHMWKGEEWHTKFFYIEFVVEKDADNRLDLIRRVSQVLDGDPAQLCQFSHWTYYVDHHWQTRCHAWNEQTLRQNIESLQRAVAKIGDMAEVNEKQENLPPVGIGQTSVRDLLKRSFVIPDYQRPYCWTAKNVERLLKDLSNWYGKHNEDGKEYHLGSIILKRCNDGRRVEVIDGQQRLITLALLEAVRNHGKSADILLGSNNETQTALDAILKAKEAIAAWDRELDLSQVVVSVVEIDNDESDDLAFNFFNHLNSSGVPLTDYELLKGHHLRFVKEDTVAEIMAGRWHALDSGSVNSLKEQLLHKCLFRIRKWLAHETFEWNADELETHNLFHEFTLGFEMPHGLCTTYKEVSIDSMLSGGLEFFDYVNRYRVMFEQFIGLDSIRAISPLQWRSNGVLHDAIVALAFLFYCKFGDVYLKDAIYAIAWNVSILRAQMGQVRRSHLGDKPVFPKAAMAIARATHESEAIGKLLDEERLPIDTDAPGELGFYWNVLKDCVMKLEGDEAALLHTHYHHAFNPSKNKK